MTGKRKLCFCAITAAVLVIAAVLAILPKLTTQCLVLKNAETGRFYAAYPIDEGGEFSVTFVHSVNKSPVTEIYEIRGGEIYVTTCVYYSLGAGVATTVTGNQKLLHGENGEMILTDIDTRIPDLVYIVGTVSDHTLEIGENEISLRGLCGRNSKVRFSIEERLFY